MHEVKNIKVFPENIPTVYINVHRMSHLAPPEKGRNEWLCRGESGANLEGSNTCRDMTPLSGQADVKLLLSSQQGTRC